MEKSAGTQLEGTAINNQESGIWPGIGYMRVRVLSQSYNEAFSFIFSVIYTQILIVCIFFTYLMFNFHHLPIGVLLAVLSAVVWCFSIMSFLLEQLTASHILSKKLITTGKQLYPHVGYRTYHSTFWKGMRPLKIQVGQYFSFESREFLLVIWGEVVISTIIDMMIAF